MPIARSECTPDITIPTDYVIPFYVEKPGANSYFTFSINDPNEFFQNGDYKGWCVQSSQTMTPNVFHSGMVYSSYDPDMPDYFQTGGIEKWKTINYLLNNKVTIFEDVNCAVKVEDVQDVIWYLIDGIDQIGDCAQTIVEYLEAHQSDIDTFCPQVGDVLVVLIDTYENETEEYSIQKVIFELPIGNEPSGGSSSHASPRKNILPTADGSKNEPYIARFNETIVFDGSKSYDYDGIILEYNWSFGDGTTKLGKSVSHIYEKAGMYEVYLNVTDDEGGKGSYNTTAQILENSPPSLPSIIGTLVCDDITKVYNYSFSSNDPENDALRYIVDWGDGSDVVTSEYFNNITKYSLSHLWNAPGVYRIKVIAEDVYHDVSDTAEVTVSVDVNRYYYAIENLKGYFIDYYKDGSIDVFHNDETGEVIALEPDNNGWYLLDVDGDGISDYKYNQASGLQPNVPSDVISETNWFMDNILVIIVIVVACIVVIFLIVFRWRNR